MFSLTLEGGACWTTPLENVGVALTLGADWKFHSAPVLYEPEDDRESS